MKKETKRKVRQFFLFQVLLDLLDGQHRDVHVHAVLDALCRRGITLCGPFQPIDFQANQVAAYPNTFFHGLVGEEKCVGCSWVNLVQGSNVTVPAFDAFQL